MVEPRLAADHHRVREIAAVAAKDHREIEDEHVAGFQHLPGGRSAPPLRSRRNGEIAVDDGGPASRLVASRSDAAVHVQLGHAWSDFTQRPGVAGVAGAHAKGELRQFVGVLLPPHPSQRPDHRRRERVVHLIVDAERFSLPDYIAQGELPRPVGVGLTVVPPYFDSVIDVGEFDIGRQHVAVEQACVAVRRRTSKPPKPPPRLNGST